MKASLRLLLEVTPEDGSDPEVDIDTHDLDPPDYEDVTEDLKRTFTVAASAAVDSIEVDIPNSSLLVIVASTPVKMRLGAAGTLLTFRTLCIGGGDEAAVAVPTTTLLFGGNGALPARVRLYAATTVP